MNDKHVCNNEGCFFSMNPVGLRMCESCMTTYINNLDEDGLYCMYVDAVNEFKDNGTFRRQIREMDHELIGDYIKDCEVFDKKMFQIINALLLMKK